MEKKARVDSAVVIVLIILLVVLLALSIFVLRGNKSSKSDESKIGSSLTGSDVQSVAYNTKAKSPEGCPYTSGEDSDKDSIIDLCDNCPFVYNPDQNDQNKNEIGDVCEPVTERRRGGGGGGNEGRVTCERNRDCGADHFIGNPFCIDSNVTQQFISYTCHHPGSENSFCSNQTTTRLVEQCLSPNVCYQGACSLIQCFVDAQCNDNNPLTFDQCENPGTPNSFCENTPIECSQNLDCGNTTVIGNPFCINNDIFQNFSVPRCENGGQLNASCEFDITQLFNLTCQYACTQGQCIRCDENSDCDDNNPQTQDVCINPGTLQSYCVNNEINIPQCRDGVDNDGDGAIDLADFSCQGDPNKDDETNPRAQCQDSIDNDGDYMIDMEDPSCTSPQHNDESPQQLTQCADRIDNDGDSYIDWPLDPQCRDRTDNSELVY